MSGRGRNRIDFAQRGAEGGARGGKKSLKATGAKGKSLKTKRDNNNSQFPGRGRMSHSLLLDYNAFGDLITASSLSLFDNAKPLDIVIDRHVHDNNNRALRLWDDTNETPVEITNIVVPFVGPVSTTNTTLAKRPIPIPSTPAIPARKIKFCWSESVRERFEPILHQSRGHAYCFYEGAGNGRTMMCNMIAEHRQLQVQTYPSWSSTESWRSLLSWLHDMVARVDAASKYILVVDGLDALVSHYDAHDETTDASDAWSQLSQLVATCGRRGQWLIFIADTMEHYQCRTFCNTHLGGAMIRFRAPSSITRHHWLRIQSAYSHLDNICLSHWASLPMSMMAMQNSMAFQTKRRSNGNTDIASSSVFAAVRRFISYAITLSHNKKAKPVNLPNERSSETNRVSRSLNLIDESPYKDASEFASFDRQIVHALHELSQSPHLSQSSPLHALMRSSLTASTIAELDVIETMTRRTHQPGLVYFSHWMRQYLVFALVASLKDNLLQSCIDDLTLGWVQPPEKPTHFLQEQELSFRDKRRAALESFGGALELSY